MSGLGCYDHHQDAGTLAPETLLMLSSSPFSQENWVEGPRSRAGEEKGALITSLPSEGTSLPPFHAPF